MISVWGEGVGGSLSSIPVSTPSTRGPVKVERGRELEVTIGYGRVPDRRGCTHFHSSSRTSLKKEVGSDVTDCALPCGLCRREWLCY